MRMRERRRWRSNTRKYFWSEDAASEVWEPHFCVWRVVLGVPPPPPICVKYWKQGS